MKRIDLYKRLLTEIQTSLLSIPLSDDDKNLFWGCDIVGDINGMCERLLNATGLPIKLKPLIIGIKEKIQWTEETKEASVNNKGCVINLAVPYKKSVIKRDFQYFSDELSYISTNTLTNSAEPYSDKILAIVEKICLGKQRQKQLLELIVNGISDRFTIIYKPSVLLPGSTTIDSHRLYHYALLAFINKPGVLSFNDDLKKSTPTVFNSNLTFTNGVEYEQYLDIYDVMNEWQHASDYLASFLKMYQVMEFMAYRTLLANLVGKNDIRHSFLRAVKKLDNSFSNNERNTFTQQLSTIFNDFDSCKSKITVAVENFVKDHFASDKKNSYISATMATSDLAEKILFFIYDVRCSIVHNKESELHFTLYNYDTYKCLLPLMKEIEKIVREKIILTISNINTPIKYPHPSLELF